MAYYTGTLAATTTPASDMMTTLDPYITSNGFTFVETVTNGTNVTNVYKSPAANNTLSMDWYLFMNRTNTTATTVGLGIAEAYNSTTHLATKYAPYGVPTTANTSDYTVSDSGVTPYSVTLGAGIFYSNTGFVGLTTTGTKTWYFNVTADRVICGLSTTAGGSTSSCTYAGICDPLIDNWNVVLFTGQAGYGASASSSYAATTRDYGLNATVSTSTNGAYAWHAVVVGGSGSSYFGYGLGNYTPGATAGPGTAADVTYGNGLYRPSRLPISGRGSISNAIGLLKDMILLATSVSYTTTIAGGDTVAVTSSAGTLNYVRPDSSSLGTAGYYGYWIPKQ